MTSSPRVLLLYAKAGAGHRRAAEAIATRLRQLGATVATHDAMRCTHPLFRAIYVGGGLGLITRLPRLFDLAYRAADRYAIECVLRSPRYQAQRLSSARLLDTIHAFRPDAIACTHFLPAELCAGWRRSGQLTSPLLTVVTDFEPHRLWQHNGTDGYCVASEAAADRLVLDGIDRSIIQVTGIPIQSEFAGRLDRAAARDRLRIRPGRSLLLIMGGGLGVGGIDHVARSLIRHPLDAQVTIITGSNRALRRQLKEMSADWIVRGFVDNMPDWLAAADVAISKAGGLAASELMAAAVPMIIPASSLTGHESANARYLVSQGTAIMAESDDDAVNQAAHLLNDSVARAPLQAAALRAARPLAAEASAEFVLRRARCVKNETNYALRNTQYAIQG